LASIDAVKIQSSWLHVYLNFVRRCDFLCWLLADMVTKWQESHREERFEKFRAKRAAAMARHKLNEAKRIAQEAGRQAT
jgi:hypothetical protein